MPYLTQSWFTSTSTNITNISLTSSTTTGGNYTISTTGDGVWYPSGVITCGQLNHIEDRVEPLSDEEREQQRIRGEERARVRHNAEVAEREQRRLAQERAEMMLLSLLTETQVLQYRRDETFEVEGSAGGRYRISPGTNGNVEYLGPDGDVTARLCAHPELYGDGGRLPLADVALAQMLILATDEQAFLRTANVHWGRRPQLAA